MDCYLITNKINNKKYVGITSGRLGLRVDRHIKDAKNGSPLLLHRAIRKYGMENFSVEILVSASNYQELQEIEKKMIAELKTHSDRGGYNLTLGGDGGNTLLNPEVKKRHKKSLKKVQASNTEKYLEWIKKNPEKHAERVLKVTESIQKKWQDPNFKQSQLDNNDGLFKKGHKDSLETRLRKSVARNGMKQSETHKKNIGKALKGRVFSTAWKEKISKANKNKVMAYCLSSHKNMNVSKQEFDASPNLVGIKSKKAQIDKAISSQASQACEDGSSTTWCDTNLSRNTRLAPDNLSQAVR